MKLLFCGIALGSLQHQRLESMFSHRGVMASETTWKQEEFVVRPSGASSIDFSLCLQPDRRDLDRTQTKVYATSLLRTLHGEERVFEF
jgi:hypothetical protein